MTQAAPQSVSFAPYGADASSSAARVAEWHRQGWWRDEDLWSGFARVAAQRGAQPAIIDGARTIDYHTLAGQAARLAGALTRLGVRPGDTVVVHGRNSLESSLALWACACAGAIMTPIPPMYSASQLGSVFASARPRAVLATGVPREVATCAEAVAGCGDAPLFIVPDPARVGVPAEAFDALLRDPPLTRASRRADDLALLVYSSGTTGLPKGVMHSANSARHAIAERVRLHRVQPGEPALVVAQFGFVGSIVFGHLLGALTGLCSIFLASWDADEALRLIERHRISYLLMMPTHAHDVLASPLLGQLDTSCLRRGAMGGLTQAQRRAVAERFCKPLPAYGMSECLGFTSCDVEAGAGQWLTSDGVPFAGTEVRVVDADFKDLPRGEIGLICYRSGGSAREFYRDPEASAQSFRDGWYVPGDLGFVDADGFVTLTGREKDMIIRGGANVYPNEIESVLLTHADVAEAAVVGAPSAEFGEEIVAFVTTRSKIDPARLRDLCAAQLAPYKVPKVISVLGEMPRTNVGKIDKQRLRAGLAAADGAAQKVAEKQP